MNFTAIAGIGIPDTTLARDITEFVRASESELLFRHSLRTYFWGALKGRRFSMRFDPELLFAASMFHDMGLTSRYEESQVRFELDGADAARSFLEGYGLSPDDLQKVWLAIALHTTPGIPDRLSPEAALVQSAAGMDIVGRGFADFTPEERDAVISAYPRGSQFKSEIIDTFYEGLRNRPDTTFGTFNDDFLAFKDPAFQRLDLCALIKSSPWQDSASPRTPLFR
jgi:hypothetical protein